MNNPKIIDIGPVIQGLTKEQRIWLESHFPKSNITNSIRAVIVNAYESSTNRPRYLPEASSVIKIRAFLAQEPASKFTISTMAERTGFTTLTVRTALKSLLRRGDVVQEGFLPSKTTPAYAYQITAKGLARPTVNPSEPTAVEQAAARQRLMNESAKTGAEYQLREQQRFHEASDAFFACPWNTPAYVEAVIAATHPNDPEATGEVFDFYDAEVSNEEADRVAELLFSQGSDVDFEQQEDKFHGRAPKPLGHLAQVALAYKAHTDAEALKSNKEGH